MQQQSVSLAAEDLSADALHGAAISRTPVLMPLRFFLLAEARENAREMGTGTLLSNSCSRSCKQQAT